MSIYDKDFILNIIDNITVEFKIVLPYLIFYTGVLLYIYKLLIAQKNDTIEGLRDDIKS